MEPRPHERGNQRMRLLLREQLLASMEPRPHERGNKVAPPLKWQARIELQWSHVLTNVETPVAARRGKSKPGCFNGATSSRTWKPVTRLPTRGSLPASMEPRPHERGNNTQNSKGELSNDASMEPRPHERGNPCPRARMRPSDRAASMEPRPHERGNISLVSRSTPTGSGFNGATSSRTWKQDDGKISPSVAG